MVWGQIAAAVAPTVISALMPKKNTESTTIEQKPMMTPEQLKALSDLSNFSKTGKFGNYTAGESYKGSLGNYDMTGLEGKGQNALSSLMDQNVDFSNLTGAGSMAKGQLANLFKTDGTSTFDPRNNTGVYEGFKKNALRENADSTNRLKRDMAFGGNLFSSATAGEAGALNERTQDQLTNKSAELYDQFAGRQFQGINMALGADQLDLQNSQFGLDKAKTEEAMNMGRIGASQQYGGLERNLQNAQADAAYQEWQRSREESKDPLKALSSILGANANYGVQSLTLPGVQQSNPWSDVLNTGIGAFSNLYAGGAFNKNAAPKLNSVSTSSRSANERLNLPRSF